MIYEQECRDWEDFEAAIQVLFENSKQRRKRAASVVSEPMFRGLADESWGLKTTLERYTTKTFSMEEYFKIVRGVLPALQSHTGRTWDLQDYKQTDESGPNPPHGYPLMIYLRHHGFPSPLLDWTLSPYVAAFFAFRPRLINASEHVAIYSYIEYAGQAKGWSADLPAVFGVGRYITTDRRHHIQQCQYTFAKKKQDKEYVYCDHETAFQQAKAGLHDLANKYLIPRSERRKVLEKLHFMNINAYSLFSDEETLMEELAYQEIGRSES